MRKVAGVGVNDMGWSSDESHCGWYHRKVYDCWKSMLHRCYLKSTQVNRGSYAGCIVCERWKVLSNFYEDIQKLPGYIFWALPGSKYALDKDILRGYQMEYSLRNCMFIYTGSNTVESNRRNYQWSKAVSTPGRCKSLGKEFTMQSTYTGEILTFKSIKEASIVLGIDASYLGKRRKTGGQCKEWRFI